MLKPENHCSPVKLESKVQAKKQVSEKQGEGMFLSDSRIQPRSTNAKNN